ncbi:MAG: hypothetical protein WC847_02685 [Candidatus Paceibacterota bacterium]|jgi:FMN phosphatase YigB (HAD superfamily)
MKYIFDFDDVLFNNTVQLKARIFKAISEAGVPEDKAREYYLEVRVKEFSLRDFIKTLFNRCNVKLDADETYETIMTECSKFMNVPLIRLVEKFGKDNCYIITNGEHEFNQDKIKYSGIGNLFKKIYIVPGSKKETIEEICDDNKNEKVFFVDNRTMFFEDLDFKKCPNLKTILYTGQSAEKLMEEFSS